MSLLPQCTVYVELTTHHIGSSKTASTRQDRHSYWKDRWHGLVGGLMQVCWPPWQQGERPSSLQGASSLLAPIGVTQ